MAMMNSIEKWKKLLFMLLKAALIALALVAIGSYIFFCPPILSRNFGSAILFPMPPGGEYSCLSVNQIKRQEIHFKNKEMNNLEGWYFQAANKSAPVILFAHGNAGNIGHRLMLVKYLMDAGASVFIFDYRNYGRSEGKKDLAGLAEDTEAALSCLQNDLKIAPSNIVLYGESIGGGAACAVAAKHPELKGLIIDSSFTSMLNLAKKKIPLMHIYPDFFQAIPSYNNKEYLQGKHLKLLIIHGQKDEAIPYSEAEANFAAATDDKTLLTLPNSTHNWKDQDFQLYSNGVAEFLRTLK
ncbi:MAG: alpha/beta hydrolase [Candidatus Obscuribacterales bacterium]|nr:alpha/beta hydrolase [Candidatus Obscuribacterales bacterium]